MITSNNENSSESNIDPTILFEAISHKRRIRILQFLAEKPAKFSEIKKMLEISSSGNVSHHLTKLDPLITKNRTGLYSLTKYGREALLSIEIAKKSKRKILQESYTWFSASIFYAIFITIAYCTSNPVIWIPFLGLGLTLGFYGIITWSVRKRVKKGDWFFLFGKNWQ